MKKNILIIILLLIIALGVSFLLSKYGLPFVNKPAASMLVNKTTEKIEETLLPVQVNNAIYGAETYILNQRLKGKDVFKNSDEVCITIEELDATGNFNSQNGLYKGYIIAYQQIDNKEYFSISLTNGENYVNDWGITETDWGMSQSYMPSDADLLAGNGGIKSICP